MKIIILFIILICLFLFNQKSKNKELIKLNPNLSKSDIKQIKIAQKKMSNMLKVFDDICQKHNIRYFLIGGSAIGAILYKGWIPWDGDVDLEVHEDDYDKLKKALRTEVPDTMWFQHSETDENYPKNANIISKLRDLNSCYIEFTNNDEAGKLWHNGLQIDINIYKENNGKITFPDDLNVNYLTYNDVYPIKRIPFENFNVNIMNNSKKYLDNKYGTNWTKILAIDKRTPHEGLVDAEKTCKHHYKLYPNLYSN